MTKYLKSSDSDWYRQRLFGLICFVIAAFIILALRLFYLQVVEGAELRRLSENNCIRLQSVDATRGLIYDRRGTLLVDNRPSFDLSIILKDAKPVEQTILKLSQYIGIPVTELAAKIKKGRGTPSYKPILLKDDIGREALAAVEVHKYDLPGIVVDIHPRRQYINSLTAAHLLGYLGEINASELACGKYPGCRGGDYIGKFGVEKAFESYLRGQRGGRQVEVDATGKVVRVIKTVEAQPGHNVYLSIDRTLQEKAEALLEGVVGAVAVMEPASGQLLALASSPSFDQNLFVSGISYEQWHWLKTNPFRPMENKAIQAEYPPASTYKMITAMAGLEEKIIDETTTFYCPGFHRYGNRTFRCWKRAGHGTVDVYKALAQSCDVYFYQVGQKLGVDRLAWYAKACGLGARTGVALDHEARGLIPTVAWKKRRTGVVWHGGETLSVAIGQGYNLTTPLQMLVLTSAVANGGTRYKPLILKSIKTADGSIVEGQQPEILGKLPVSRETLEMVQRGLWEVVNHKKGTARIARLEGIEISGKTGTAQVISRKKNDPARDKERASHLLAHAWFVAFAPSVDPRIAVSVIVEHGEHGSSTAAPIAKELIATYLASPADAKLTASRR